MTTNAPPRSRWAAETPSARSKRDQILAIGLPHGQAGSISSRLFGALGHSTDSVDLDHLSPDLLGKAMVVVSPVVGTQFDVIDIAERLHAHGYTGRYVAYAAQLPDHGMIAREVSHVAPDLSFAIVETGAGPDGASSPRSIN